MPLYEYRCGECGRLTEKIQKFSDPELTVCPYCSGPLARTLTAAAVHFSGGGWYKDLYSSAKPPAANGDKPAGATDGAGEKTGEKTGDKPGNTAAPASSTGDSGASAPAASPSPAAASTPAPATSKE